MAVNQRKTKYVTCSWHGNRSKKDKMFSHSVGMATDQRKTKYVTCSWHGYRSNKHKIRPLIGYDCNIRRKLCHAQYPVKFQRFQNSKKK